jgi:hypothetical protein
MLFAALRVFVMRFAALKRDEPQVVTGPARVSAILMAVGKDNGHVAMQISLSSPILFIPISTACEMPHET